MKKIYYCCLIIIVAIIVIFINVKSLQKQKLEIQKFNNEFNEYIGREIYGSEVATVINKISDYNKRNQETIQLEVTLINKLPKENEEEETQYEYITYNMNIINKVGIGKFVQNFNTLLFECSNVEYNKTTGKINKLVYTQIKE